MTFNLRTVILIYLMPFLETWASTTAVIFQHLLFCMLEVNKIINISNTYAYVLDCVVYKRANIKMSAACIKYFEIMSVIPH